MQDLISQMTTLHWVILAITLLVGMFYWWRRSHEPAWFDFLYNFPIPMFGHIGKLKRLKGNTEQVANRQSWINGMPSPENSLCGDYNSVMKRAKSLESFRRAQEYLRLSYQSDISPMPFWKFTVLFALTIAEAMGTGFLMAPFISSEMSSAQIGYAGWVLAVALAILLLVLTHHAGKSAKKIVSLKHALGTLDKNARPHDLTDDSPISASSPQEIDEGKSGESRFYRRVVKLKDRGSWAPTVGVVVLLSLVLAMVFMVRWEGIKKQNTLEVAQMEKSGAADSSADSGNPFSTISGGDANALPPDVVKNQQQARDKVAKEVGAADRAQGFGAAILLAGIYLLTQAAGFWFAFEHAFVGEGQRAFDMTMGEPDYQSYHSKYIHPYESRAESRLAELRRHFGSVIPGYGQNPSTMTFRQYVQDRQNEIEAKPAATIPPTAAYTHAPAAPVASVDTPTASPSPSVASVDHDAAAETIMALPEAERGAAIANWLKSNGVDHKDRLKDALARFKERKAGMDMLDDEFLNLAKD